MPIVEGKRNRLWQPVYDTINLAAAAVSGSFFAVQFGGILVGTTPKSYAHTNLVQAGRLERDTTFYINGLSLFVRETATRATAADIRALNQGSFDLQLGQVSFFRVPIAVIPNGGAELELFSNITPAATEYQLNKGVSASGNRLLFEQPLQILEQETIQANIADFLMVAAVQVTCVLWGTTDRPVR
jgi:hypothetical protein